MKRCTTLSCPHRVQYSQEEAFRAIFNRNATTGVLFYCKQGANRSGLFCVMYTAMLLNTRINYAYRHVQGLRPIVYLDRRWEGLPSLLDTARRFDVRLARLSQYLGTDRAEETVILERPDWDDVALRAVEEATQAARAAALAVSDRGARGRPATRATAAEEPTQQVDATGGFGRSGLSSR